MTENACSNLNSLLQQVVCDKLDNYEVRIDGANEAGAGYMGEMDLKSMEIATFCRKQQFDIFIGLRVSEVISIKKVFVTLKNRTNNEISHFAIKQTLSGTTQSTKELLGDIYSNEIYFYQKVVTEYENFQKRFPKAKPFDKFPKCLACQTEEGKQKILMENLKSLGFKTLPRTGNFDDRHTKLLMRAYGHFHGISAAYREHNPEQFKKLASYLKDTTTPILTNLLSEKINIVMNHVMQIVEDENIREKLKIFTEKGVELAVNSLKYNGKNPVVNHGDCWSNNIMFKYDNNGNVEDVRCVDFQLSRMGSVVSDLSYLLFSGVKKDILDNMDYYFKIYYDTFSDTLRDYDLKPDKIFNFGEFKRELKEHYAFGFVMSQLAWPGKLSPSYEKRNFAEIVDEEGNKREFDQQKIYQDLFSLSEIRENCLNIVKYLFQAEIL